MICMTSNPAPNAGLEWGPLFSHYSEDHCSIDAFGSQAAAVAHGERIATAQPGIEYELMRREHGKGQWLSSAAGETLRQVIDRRWPRF
jgi:hypothetical protein